MREWEPPGGEPPHWWRDTLNRPCVLFPPTVPDRISTALRTAIRTSGKSVSCLCRDAGVSQGVVYRLLSGKAVMRLGSLDKLAEVLRLELVVRGEEQQED